MKRSPALLAAALLLLTACARTESAPAPSDPAAAAVSEPAPTAAPETEVPAGMELFPRSFSFASGAGAWSTELEVAADGSFTGRYHDSDMGDAGTDYPDGTVYVCTFHGQFSQPEQVDEYTYVMHLESIETEETEGEETIAGGVRFVGSTPYGLDGADEIRIYLPGSRRQDLPEGFVSWTWAFDPWESAGGSSQSGEDRLTCFGLYNAAGDAGFVETGNGTEME